MNTATAYINIDTLEIRAVIGTFDGVEYEEWVQIPRYAGIVWRPDQSANEIRLSESNVYLSPCNYVFVAASDIPLLSEYADQIAEALAQ